MAGKTQAPLEIKPVPFSVSVFLALADAASAYYSPRLGRFLNRDPINEPGAALIRQAAKPTTAFIPRDPIGQGTEGNRYRFVDNSPVIFIDALGLWKVERTGQARADAEAENNDTPGTLATKVKLSPSEFKKWMKLTGATIKTLDGRSLTLEQLEQGTKICPKERVTVPNTGYIDVGTYSWGFLGWYLMGYKSGLNDRWSQEGLKVVYTGKWSTTKAGILSDLGSTDIYKFAYIGHGAAGCMTGLSGGDGIIAGGTYTPFGIVEMHIIACESNDAAWAWKQNVSASGWLRTVKGELTIYGGEFVDEPGAK